MAKKPLRRRILGRRWTGLGVIVTGLLEAIGIGSMFWTDTLSFVVAASVGFVLFVIFVALYVMALLNEIEDKEELLANRSRRAWIRGQLDQFGNEYKAIMDVGDTVENAKIDQRLKNFCELNGELDGYWTRFTAGASRPKIDPPNWIKTQEQVDVWHRCQTRRFHLADIIAEFSDAQNG